MAEFALFLRLGKIPRYTYLMVYSFSYTKWISCRDLLNSQAPIVELMLCCHLNLCKEGSSNIKCSYPPHATYTTQRNFWGDKHMSITLIMVTQCMPVSKFTKFYTSHLCSFCTSIKLFLKRKEKKMPAGSKRGSYTRFAEGLEWKKKETSPTRFLIPYKCPCALNQGTLEKWSMPVPLSPACDWPPGQLSGCPGWDPLWRSWEATKPSNCK